jgi:hypothetical protein
LKSGVKEEEEEEAVRNESLLRGFAFAEGSQGESRERRSPDVRGPLLEMGNKVRAEGPLRRRGALGNRISHREGSMLFLLPNLFGPSKFIPMDSVKSAFNDS